MRDYILLDTKKSGDVVQTSSASERHKKKRKRKLKMVFASCNTLRRPKTYSYALMVIFENLPCALDSVAGKRRE